MEESKVAQQLLDTECEWNVSFSGVEYVVNLNITSGMICLEIEDIKTNERWVGDFTSQCKFLNPFVLYWGHLAELANNLFSC